MTGPDRRSLPEHHGTVPVSATGPWIRRLFAFAGPAYLVSVGYMDPGNWATDLAGGARFGYQLVWVIVLSNLLAILLQTLAARFGVVTGRDLAQACREYYPRWLVMPLWLMCELAIVACDLAEVLGAAIGLQLLFGLPLMVGVLLTALDVLLLLAFSRLGMRWLEALILSLIATMGLCFGVEILLSRPDWAAVLSHVIPRGADGAPSLFGRGSGGGLTVLGLQGDSLYIAMGILGATVMPHNLYLHSALVQSRAVAGSVAAKREACRMNTVDSAIALNTALLVNGAILVLAASTFYFTGHHEVARLEDAHRLLAPLLGTSLASTLFAVALLASGQASTITGTLAGQIVMEGFLHWRIQPWLRRMISRGLAIVPAIAFIALRGERSVDSLLVLSQVVLSLQLSFAVVPLVTFTSDRRLMGGFANPPWLVTLAVLASALIIGLNAKLVYDTLSGWFANAGPGGWWLPALVLPVVIAIALLLAYIVAMPLLRRLAPALATAAPEPARPVEAGAPHLAPGERTPAPYRRIALALELGEADRPVLEHVRSLVLRAGAEVVLLHVVESAAGRFLGRDTLDREAREDQTALDDLATELQAAGFSASGCLGFGDVKSELARLVEEIDADLLITGSHGHRLLEDLVHGSTTSGLRHLVRCPVLTLPARERRQAAGGPAPLPASGPPR